MLGELPNVDVESTSPFRGKHVSIHTPASISLAASAGTVMEIKILGKIETPYDMDLSGTGIPSESQFLGNMMINNEILEYPVSNSTVPADHLWNIASW